MKNLVFGLLLLLLGGCAQGHKQFYRQVAPKKYPPTSDVMIFRYGDVEIEEIYNLLFSDLLIIGKSSFNGAYQNPDGVRSYAKSIGSDVLITACQFQAKRTAFVNIETQTDIRGHDESGSFYGTATTYGTETITVPIRVNRYDQEGLYLRNLAGANLLWERSEEQYEDTDPNVLSGLWENEHYSIKIFQSGSQIVGFIDTVIDGTANTLPSYTGPGPAKWRKPSRQFWSKGQLKMLFGVASIPAAPGSSSGAPGWRGLYLMGNKTPMPAKFSVNKFGHLVVEFLAPGGGTESDTFSFMKIP